MSLGGDRRVPAARRRDGSPFIATSAAPCGTALTCVSRWAEYNVVELLALNVGNYISYRAIYDALRSAEILIRAAVSKVYRANVRSAIKRRAQQISCPRSGLQRDRKLYSVRLPLAHRRRLIVLALHVTELLACGSQGLEPRVCRAHAQKCGGERVELG